MIAVYRTRNTEPPPDRSSSRQRAGLTSAGQSQPARNLSRTAGPRSRIPHQKNSQQAEGTDADLDAAVDRIRANLTAIPGAEASPVTEEILYILDLTQVSADIRLGLARERLTSAAAHLERNVFELLTGSPIASPLSFAAQSSFGLDAPPQGVVGGGGAAGNPSDAAHSSGRVQSDLGPLGPRSGKPPKMTPSDRHNLLMLHMLEGGASDALYFAAKVQGYTTLNYELRQEEQTVRDELRKLVTREALAVEVEASFGIQGAEDTLETREQLEAYLEELEAAKASVGGDRSAAMLVLQPILQRDKEQEEREAAISKLKHDTALAVVRNMG